MTCCLIVRPSSSCRRLHGLGSLRDTSGEHRPAAAAHTHLRLDPQASTSTDTLHPSRSTPRTSPFSIQTRDSPLADPRRRAHVDTRRRARCPRRVRDRPVVAPVRHKARGGRRSALGGCGWEGLGGRCRGWRAVFRGVATRHRRDRSAREPELEGRGTCGVDVVP